MGLFSGIQKLALAPSVAIGNAISNVIKPGSGKTTTSQLQATTPGKILGTAIAGTAITAGALALPAGSIASAGSAIKSSAGTFAKANPIKTAVAGFLAPTAVVAVVNNPSVVGKSASAVYDFQKTGISVASGQQSFVQGAVDYVGDHPIASSIAGLVGLGAIVKTAIPAIAGYSNTLATRENTEAILNSQQLPAQELPSVYPQDALDQGSPVPAPIEATTGKSVSRRKRRKSKAKEPLRQTISQRVNVEVNQNRVSKTYLNRISVPQ